MSDEDLKPTGEAMLRKEGGAVWLLVAADDDYNSLLLLSFCYFDCEAVAVKCPFIHFPFSLYIRRRGKKECQKSSGQLHSFRKKR